MTLYDVIIIGGGHAGTEAAAAAARLGARTALITHQRDTIGAMSCNPAIGGLGKGHLVREIDALDGLMGRAADASGIQFRLLNRSRGPAVRGPRAQIDRRLYRASVQEMLASVPGLEIIEDAADLLLIEDGAVCGISGASGRDYRAGAIVLTTGTFLNGVIHRGGVREAAGRIGEAPSVRLAEQLAELNLPMGRLKTGTPPRLLKSSIAWESLEQQEADSEPVPFSFLTEQITTPQMACAITWTNSQTHRIIQEHIDESAVYSGAVSGKGPRYCPSIEDKVTRFADRDRHQVFLEPEGLKPGGLKPGGLKSEGLKSEALDSELVYPNGVSTSLGEAAQRRFIRTMAGLEQAEIAQYGYAIEYDYVDPRCLGSDLQLQGLPGLYLAGQINGTTGYEEAAAQGLIAGLNAARRAGGQSEPVTLDRAQAYIGVLIDDLITKGVSEPYRMFTSRAEFRLLLRADNADLRLTPSGLEWGCVGSARADVFRARQRAVERARSLMDKLSLTPEAAAQHNIKVNRDGRRRSALQLLALTGVDFERLEAVWPELASMPEAVREPMRIEALYEGYLERQAADIRKFRRDEALRLPADLDYSLLSGLSAEVCEKLQAVRPGTLGQAARLEGVTPGALTALLAHVKRQDRRKAG